MKIAISLLVAVVAIVAFLAFSPRSALPPHMLGHPVIDRPNFFTEKMANDLLEFTRSVKTIPSSTRDSDFTKPSREDIGEAMPMPCTNPFLLPNRNRTQCVFPGRIDVGRH